MTLKSFANTVLAALIAFVAMGWCTLSAIAQEIRVYEAISNPNRSVFLIKAKSGERVVVDAVPLRDIVAAEQDSIPPDFNFWYINNKPQTVEGERLKKLLDGEILTTTRFLELLQRQDQELDAYFRCHSKKDEGYKEVNAFAKRHQTQVKRVKDYLKRLHSMARICEHGEASGRRTDVPAYSIYAEEWKNCELTPDEVVIFHDTDSLSLCDNALTMKHLFAPIADKYMFLMDRKKNVFLYLERELVNRDAAFFGERFGCDGSYYQGYFNADDQREGKGFCIDDKLVKCGEWEADSYFGQVLKHHKGRIYGIDISRYNHDMKNEITVPRTIVTSEGNDSIIYVKTKTADIDWTDLRITELGPNSPKVDGEVNYPVEFAFIKCSEGMDLLSKYYNADLDSCLAHGIRVAPYHFYSSKSKPIDQVANFIANARINECTMRPMLDVEPEPHQIREMGGIDACIGGMALFVREVEKATGRKCVLYLNQNFVKQYYHLFPEELRQCDIWIAKYHERHPYTRFCIWQFGSKGRVKGIYGNVDLNVFNGNRKEFERWCEAE